MTSKINQEDVEKLLRCQKVFGRQLKLSEAMGVKNETVYKMTRAMRPINEDMWYRVQAALTQRLDEVEQHKARLEECLEKEFGVTR